MVWISGNRKRTNRMFFENNIWEGSCYGMSTTAILGCYGILKPNPVGSTYDVTECSDKIKTLINSYHALQDTDLLIQYRIHAQYTETESQKLQRLITCLSDGSPTLLDYRERLNHTVVAYGLEKGNYNENGEECTDGEGKYKGKVLIYDCNIAGTDNKYCFYYNLSENGCSWTVPAYNYSYDSNNEKETNPNKLGLIIDDIELINYHGKVNGSSYFKVFEHYYPILESTTIKEIIPWGPSYLDGMNNVIRKARYNDGGWNSIATADDDIIYYILPSSDYSDGIKGDIKYAMTDQNSGYIVKKENPESFGLMLSYENTLMKANAVAGTEAKFAPSGCVAVSGENTDYELEIVLNDGYMVNDWYDLTVKGSGVNDATLEKSENGYVLNATNLKDVYIKAESDEAVKSCVFSTDYPEVFIFEKDGNTIGAAVDTDNNGTYETEIETKEAEYESLKLEMTTDVTSDGTTTTNATTSTSSTTTTSTNAESSKPGDVNGDDIIDARDATAVLTYYAITSTGGKFNSSDFREEYADYNEDGVIDGRDATAILTFYAKSSTK